MKQVVFTGAGQLAPHLKKKKLTKSPRDKMVRPEQVKMK
jgi:hypothetical protein